MNGYLLGFSKTDNAAKAVIKAQVKLWRNVLCSRIEDQSNITSVLGGVPKVHPCQHLFRHLGADPGT